ncbi:MAG: fibronectin type III domain-containing protein [Pyrinomonadaceae bacterium]|nr:fibronectin type III domain-containing protein [Pyrinomonadaceae bacterium]
MTNVYTRGLELFLEADTLAGANGASVSSWTDLSGKGRNLTASSNQPTVKTNALNGKKSVNFNGSRNPLKWTGNLEIRCGFAVVKVNSFASFDGVLTGLANAPILIGGGAGASIFFDVKYKYYEYRLKDRIYSPVETWANGERIETLNAPAPVGGFAIIYFKFWTNLQMDGVQLGQDRADASRKFNGEISLIALYNRDFCESEIRNMMRSLSYSYQLPISEVYPYSGMRNDPRTLSTTVLTDGQREPNVRVKYSQRRDFALSFNDRTMREIKDFRTFWNQFYPAQTFIYRDLNLVPPEDTACRFVVPQEPQINENLNFSTYSFNVFESTWAVGTFTVTNEPVIPDEAAPIVTLSEFGGPYSGTAVPFYVEADEGAAFVKLLIDGVTYAEFAGTDHIFEVNTTTFPNGSHTIQGTGTDSAGNVGYSEVLTVEFDNDLISPTTVTDLEFTVNTAIRGTIAFTLPTDNVAIVGYDLSLNGVESTFLPADLILVSGSIYSYEINGLVPNTLYNVKIRARDEVGNVAQWSNIRRGTTPALVLSNGSNLTLTVPRSGEVDFDTDISSPVWTLDGAGALNQSGIYTAPNTAGTATIRAHSSFWNYVNTSFFTKNDDDTLTKNTSTAGYFMQAKSNGTLNTVGDWVEFIVAKTNPYWVGLENDATNYRAVYYAGGNPDFLRFYHPGGDTFAAIAGWNVNDIIKMEIVSGGYIRISRNGSVVYTTSQVFSGQNLRFITDADLPNGTIVKVPKMFCSNHQSGRASITIS